MSSWQVWYDNLNPYDDEEECDTDCDYDVFEGELEDEENNE